jgi:hydrogenase-4 component F
MFLFALLIIPITASVLSISIGKTLSILRMIALSAAVAEIIAVIAAVLSVAKFGSYSVTAYLGIDYLSSVLILIIGIVGCAVLWYSSGYLSAEVSKQIIGLRRVRQYFTLLHLFLFAMFFAATTTNPVLMWIAVEATTLSTAFLISFYNKPSALEAAWKYLILNSVGLLLAFFGTLLFSGSVLGEGTFITWAKLAEHANLLDPFIVKIAFLFVLVGYGTKVGLAPMHTWLPDAHSKAPAPISALLSGVLLNVAFLAILRFKLVTDTAIGVSFSQNLLIGFGLASMLIAGSIIFIQKNYKRLLAYSSIEHMGIAALGFGFGGMAAYAGLLHMVYHALAKSALFLSAGNIFLKYSSTKIANVQEMLAILPRTSVLFIIGFLAITGVPPFGIFLTEFSILSAGFGAHPFIVLLALGAIVLVFVGFLRHIVSMVYGRVEDIVPPPEVPIIRGEMGIWTLAPIFALLVLLVVLSIYVPPMLSTLITNATLMY